MYKKVDNFSIEGSCSALMNNLCCFMDKDKVHLACVYKSAVNILVINPDGTSRCHMVPLKDSSTFNSLSMILQAKWVIVKKNVMLVIASQRGIQVFDENGKILLYWYGLPTNTIDSAEVTFTRGIAACDNLLCIGTHNGIILTFEVSESSNIELMQNLKGHNTAITDLCGENGKLASGDEEGVICLWEYKKTFGKMKTLKKFDFPCTSLSLWKDLVLAAFGSGHLRVFCQSTGSILAEVTAHARWITAVDIAAESGLGLSVSEDSFIRIWRLQNDEKPIISHEYSCNVADTQLCGGCFMDSAGSAFFATGYDLHEVVKFST